MRDVMEEGSGKAVNQSRKGMLIPSERRLYEQTIWKIWKRPSLRLLIENASERRSVRCHRSSPVGKLSEEEEDLPHVLPVFSPCQKQSQKRESALSSACLRARYCLVRQEHTL